MTSQLSQVTTSPQAEGPQRTAGLYALAELLQSTLAISMRGLLVLLVLLYLFLNPILNQSDIVASILTAALAGLIIVVTAICAVTGFRLKKRLNPELIFPSHSDGIATEGIFSGASNKVLLRVGPLTIPPLFTLSVELAFEQAGVSSSCHLLTGQLDPSTPVIHRITFPHRGLWRVTGIRCVLEDRFGFSCVIWSDQSQSDLVVAVHPPRAENPRLPIISSTFRAGDDISHHTQRLGEPFDIKPYHPSDGIKKILWKVFAKRGELVARHPEHAVTPEGHVIAYVLATREDDALAAWSLAYFRELEELNLTMEVGCIGMDQLPLATDTRSLDELLVASAFQAPPDLLRTIAHEIRFKISQRGGAIHADQSEQIALFLSESSLRSDRRVQELLRLIRSLETEGIKAVVCLKRSTTSRQTAVSHSRIRKLFFTPPSSPATPQTSLTARNAFLKSCSGSQIKVLQEPHSSEGARAS